MLVHYMKLNLIDESLDPNLCRLIQAPNVDTRYRRLMRVYTNRRRLIQAPAKGIKGVFLHVILQYLNKYCVY